MKLTADPTDFLVLQLEGTFGSISAAATSVDLAAGHGASVPSIPTGKWVAANVVNVADPDTVTLADLAAGDRIHIYQVSTDTIYFERTETARTILQGEYLFFSQMAIEQARLVRKLEDMEYFMADVAGGSGVPRSQSGDNLNVIADTPESMVVVVKAGYCVINGEIFRVREDTDSPGMAAPVTNNRYDLIVAELGTKGNLDGIAVVTGTEDPAPSVPSAGANQEALASVLLTPAHTEIVAGDIDNGARVII